MGVKIGGREFRPGLWPTLAFILLLPVLIRLGFWQLDRAEEKQALLDAIAQAEREPPVELGLPLNSIESLRYRKIVVQGEYLRGRDYLLDNQPLKGRPGYHVLTPLRLKGDPRQCVLIDRGWVPLQGDRRHLPKIATPAGEQSLVGTVWLSWRDAFRLGDAPRSGAGWPAVIQWVDPRLMAEELSCQPLPLVVRLAADAPGGYVREWPVPRIEPEKSTSYAVQWFALATTLVLIYIVVNLKKIEPPEAGRDSDTHD